ncbi:MAG: helicase C-terminal domain-containing protein, partial [Promethearchaeota archaeon]
ILLNAVKELEDKLPLIENAINKKVIRRVLRATAMFFSRLKNMLERTNKSEIKVSVLEVLDFLQALASKDGSHIDQTLKIILNLGNQLELMKLMMNVTNETVTPRSHVKTLAKFLCAIEKSTVGNFCYIFSKRDKHYHFEAINLDVNDITSKVFSGAIASISLSGTIDPDVYLRTCMRGLSGITVLKFPSPFTKGQVKTLILKGVSTSFESRTRIMYKKLKKRILEVIQATPKNVGVFCASYNVLDGIKSAGIEAEIKDFGKQVFWEETGIPARKNDDMIHEFKQASRSAGAVLFGVCGGRNSEGEDFPGDEMNAVIILGVPFSPKNIVTREKVLYFEKLFPKEGEYIGYLSRVMQKVNQACGRPVRTLDDKGVIVLADERFLHPKLLHKIPSLLKWNLKVVKDVDGALNSSVSRFFGT